MAIHCPLEVLKGSDIREVPFVADQTERSGVADPAFLSFLFDPFVLQQKSAKALALCHMIEKN